MNETGRYRKVVTGESHIYFKSVVMCLPIRVAAPFKVRVYGRYFDEISGSNHARGMDVGLLSLCVCVFFFVR
jgi:hypothetical protein